MLILECSQRCYGRTHDSVTIYIPSQLHWRGDNNLKRNNQFKCIRRVKQEFPFKGQRLGQILQFIFQYFFYLRQEFIQQEYINPCLRSIIIDNNSEHRELYSNMGMRMQHTICLMMRLKSFRPEVDKSWQSRREFQTFKKKSPINDFKTKMIS